MDAEELLVHNGSQGQTVKRVHTGIIHFLRVLDLACIVQSNTCIIEVEYEIHVHVDKVNYM